jgi:hypothetical protein
VEPVAKGNTLGSSGSHQGKIGFFLPRRRLPLHAYRLPRLSDGGLPPQLKSNEKRAFGNAKVWLKWQKGVTKTPKECRAVARDDIRNNFFK